MIGVILRGFQKSAGACDLPGSAATHDRGHGSTPALPDLQSLVLGHEVAVLRRTNPQPRLDWADPALFAAHIQRLPAALRDHHLVAPATVLRCHRRLVTKKRTYPDRSARPPLDPAIAAVIQRLARETET